MNHTAESVQCAAAAADATYSYLFAFGNLNPSRQSKRPNSRERSRWNLWSIFLLRNRKDKRAWMEKRGVFLLDHYWAGVGAGPLENSRGDLIGKAHLNEKYARPLSNFLSPCLCP